MVHLKKRLLSADGNVNSVFPQGDIVAMDLGADGDPWYKTLFTTENVANATQIAKSGVDIYNQLKPAAPAVVVPTPVVVTKASFPTWGYFAIGGGFLAVSGIILFIAKKGKKK